MPSLSTHPSSTLTKLLLIGDPGTGKTGALASLVRAGYSLKVLDFDNGLDILANLLADAPELLDKVEYETCTDVFQSINGKPMPVRAQAFPAAMKALDKWAKEVIQSPSENEVVVIDSMTLMGKAALNYILALNGRMAGPPQLQDWGAAMGLIENCMAMLYSDSFQANVVVTSHIKFIEDTDTGSIIAGYPEVIGNKLAPKIGRYFNSQLRVKVIGSGPKARRVITTVPGDKIACKTPAPGRIPAELPLETGLAEFFKLVQRKDAA